MRTRSLVLAVALLALTIGNVVLVIANTRLQARTGANLRQVQGILADNRQTLASINTTFAKNCRVYHQAALLFGRSDSLPECGQ